MIRWTSVSVVLLPLRLTAHSNVGPSPEQHSHEPHCSQFLKLMDALRAVHPQRSPSVLERLVQPEDLGWRQNSIPISCPQQLQSFGTRFSEFRAEINRLTLLLCIFACAKTQKLLRTLLTYRLLHRRGLNLGRSNCMPGFRLHLPWTPYFPFLALLRCAKKKPFSLLLGQTTCIYIYSVITIIRFAIIFVLSSYF